MPLPDPLPVPLRESDALPDADCDTEPEDERLGDVLAVSEGEALPLLLVDTEPSVLRLTLVVAHCDGEGLALVLSLADPLVEGLGEVDAASEELVDGDVLPLPLTEALGDELTLREAVSVG